MGDRRTGREIEKEVLPFAARENVGVIAYSPMASGLLTAQRVRQVIGSERPQGAHIGKGGVKS